MSNSYYFGFKFLFLWILSCKSAISNQSREAKDISTSTFHLSTSSILYPSSLQPSMQYASYNNLETQRTNLPSISTTSSDVQLFSSQTTKVQTFSVEISEVQQFSLQRTDVPTISIDVSETQLFSSQQSILSTGSTVIPEVQLFSSHLTNVPTTSTETLDVYISSSAPQYMTSEYIDTRTEYSVHVTSSTIVANKTSIRDSTQNIRSSRLQNSEHFLERNKYKIKSNKKDVFDLGIGFNFLTFLKSLASQTTILKEEPKVKTQGSGRYSDLEKVKVDFKTGSTYDDPESYDSSLTNGINGAFVAEKGSSIENKDKMGNDFPSPTVQSDKPFDFLNVSTSKSGEEIAIPVHISNRNETDTGKAEKLRKIQVDYDGGKPIIAGEMKSENKMKQNLNDTVSTKSEAMDYITSKYTGKHAIRNISDTSDLTAFSLGYLKGFQQVISKSMTNKSANSDVIRDMKLLWNQEVQKFCTQKRTYKCNSDYPYRTIDGSCNNLDHPDWGQSFQPQRRLLPAAYDDVLNSPRTKGTDGWPLPAVRELSNWLFQSDDKPRHHTNHTVMVMAWGQFVDHDMVNTPQSKEENGSKIDCCTNIVKRDECFPITIPKDDRFFTNKSCMNFVRSSAADRCMPAIREQVNAVTSYIDASNVYGSTTEEMWALREGKRGLLKVSRGDLLPKWENTKCDLHNPHQGTFCMLAGDKRANEIPNLSALHIAFVREHNRIAKKLAEVNPHWSGDDEKLFQEARKIVGAYMQQITYDEYLPTVLNRTIIEKYLLSTHNESHPHRYGAETDARVANVFAVASFRFGHSQISSHQGFVNEVGSFSQVLPIEDCFNNPELLEKEECKEGCPRIIRWMTTDTCTMADSTFETGVRDKLFMDKQGNSFDLPAINIQRGRDHGIPSYNAWRKWLGLPEIKNFDPEKSDGLVDHYPQTASVLKKVYRYVDDIDLYAGAMTERHLVEASVGPTFAILIAEQFRSLKEGDRFWFENDNQFSEEQIRSIKKVKLAKILCQNMEVEYIQAEVMFIPHEQSNPSLKCTNLLDLDFSLWKE